MLGIFPIFLIFTNNLAEISLNSLLLPIVIIFGTISISLFILIKISKNTQKATLTISLLLFLVFSIGYVRMGLGGFEISNFALDQPKFLIVIYFLIFILGLFCIYKIKDWSKPTQIISVVSIVVIISFIPTIVLDVTGNEVNTNDFYMKIEFNTLERPNIYFIILDGYANEKSLKNNFGFNNSEFLNYLKNLGFIIPEKNFSNYDSTRMSMNSVLNMNYLHHQQGFNEDNIILQKYLFSNNVVMKTFQDNNYNTIFIDGGAGMRDMKASNKILCHQTDNSLLQTLMDTSMFTYIAQGFFWDSWDTIRTCGYSELEKIQENTSEPFFVYAHIRSPHEPFLRDANGNLTRYEEKTEELDEKTSNERYIYQLKHTNERISKIITKIISSDPESVIILSSDHGQNYFLSVPPTDEELIQLFSNFEAFYLPNIDDYEPYQIITPVNVFRNIFNDYFETDLEILDDKIFFMPRDEFNNPNAMMGQIEISNIFFSEND